MSPDEHIKDEISDIEAMLPWYAAGTLTPQEAALVDAELAKDAGLRRQLELVREEMEQDVRLNEELGAPASDALSKLMAGIEAEPSHVPVSLSLKMKLSDWIEGFISSTSPLRLAALAAAAIVVIAAQTVILAGLYLKAPAGQTYQTASYGSSGQSQTGALALIAFQPRARAEEIAAFLIANDLRIVDGPKPGGFYTIRLNTGKPGADQAAKQLNTLRKNDKIVRFLAFSKRE